MEFSLRDHPHRRYNLLTREWVLVSPHRTQRPWLGQVEKRLTGHLLDYDPDCYMCPKNLRAGGQCNPSYTSTFVFENDFAALTPNASEQMINQKGLLVAQGERGICRVICFSPRHNLTLSQMQRREIQSVVEVWVEQLADLGSLPYIKYVQIFENQGAMMGASNPHPHCQVWASAHLPNEVAKEQAAQKDYLAEHKLCLLCNYLALEQQLAERVVCDNQHFSVIVPFWAIWPYETLVLAKRHVSGLRELTHDERGALADIMKRLTTRYDNLFEVSFPYSMGFHGAPSGSGNHPEWHLHAHFYPPLLRSARVRKFMVGYEMLGTPQRDITAESAAEYLRQLNEVHYLSRQSK
jgi:UDPglucose--hexose-1-phosphate uridylyltransferase